MPENSESSPVFAGRYKFQTVGRDWDKGRSGYTHLVFDMQEERLGVIKRAELESQKAVEGLKNEVAALLDLRIRSQNVPEVYDTGESEYGSKSYFYIVIEYINGLPVDKNLESLTAIERAEILSQFFGLLANAHNLGIANGDIDLKHFYWVRDKKRLAVIDWGYSKLKVEMEKSNQGEFAYDLVRAAKIVYSLVTRNGHPPSKGSLRLPNEKKELFPGISNIPNEISKFCNWAVSQTVGEILPAPYTAQRLSEITEKWRKEILGNEKDEKESGKTKPTRLILIPLIVAAFLLICSFASKGILFLNQSSTITPTVSKDSPPTEVTNIIKTEAATPATPEAGIVSPTIASVLIPSKLSFTEPFLVFDTQKNQSNCWINENGLGSPIGSPQEGFRNRDEDDWWYFKIRKKDLSVSLGDQIIQTDFIKCVSANEIKAIGIKVWFLRLEAQKEFGFFIVHDDKERTDFTIWLDTQKNMYFRTRESNKVSDQDVLIIKPENLKTEPNTYPRTFYDFPLEMLLINEGPTVDFVCLAEGSRSEPSSTQSFTTSATNCIGVSGHLTESKITKIGLVGYRGEIQSLIWSLSFFDK
ncbi:MAG: protein kinase family protein [Anaerolineales bacterium]|nr:protein kinase family protein [Anaerolineales bacterium]